MGSLNNFLTSNSYILGLLGADRYLRTSSIGLSNTNLKLHFEFLKYLLKYFNKDRVRIRVYGRYIPSEFKEFKISYAKCSKNKQPAYHVYVNSKPLVKEFFYALDNRCLLSSENVFKYFAGRFDGDGCISRSNKYCRIVYKTLDELTIDRILLPDNIKTSVYRYKQANTYCLYFSEKTLQSFLIKIENHSVSGKLNDPVSTNPNLVFSLNAGNGEMEPLSL